MPLNVAINNIRDGIDDEIFEQFSKDEEEIITTQITTMNSEFERFPLYIITAISIIPPKRDSVIKYMEVCYQILSDEEEYNKRVIQLILTSPDRIKTQFAAHYNIRVEDISTFKFPG